MKKCPYCGSQIADDCKFCSECGKEYPNGNTCRYCGALIYEGDVYCENCGKKIEKEPISAVSEQSFKSCPHCGAKLESDSIFCGECGKRLDEAVQVTKPIKQETTPIEEVENNVIPEEYEEQPSSLKQYLPYIIGGLIVLALIIGYFVWNNAKSEGMTQQITVADSLGTDSISDKVELSPQEIILERVKFIYEDAYKQASNGDSYWLTTELNSLIKENEEVTPAGEIGCIDYDIWSQSQGGDGSPSFNVKSAELLSENKAIAKIAIKYSERESYSKDVKLVLIRESNDWLIDDFITDYEGKEYSFKNDLIECIKSTKESQNEEIADAAADTIPEVTEY